LDQIGPIAKNVDDIKSVFEAISGKDQRDATSADYKFEELIVKIKGLKIGIPREYFGEGIDRDVSEIIRKAIKKAEENGAEIVEINLPNTNYAIACYYIIVPSEVSANLARYDGIKYGFSKDAEDLMRVYLKSRGEGFGSEPKRRILLGAYALSSGYYDAYYKKAQQARQLISQDFSEAFKKVDLIFTPVSPIPAFKIGEKIDDPLSMYLMDVYTCPVKLAGLPALSLPAGFISSETSTDGQRGYKLPVGLQIIGNNFEENKILSVAEQMEKMLEYK
jgi:aspartyl-tRNA(Asn)/glutamyl-tRNA(Gln) amidotransferase subunit A